MYQDRLMIENPGSLFGRGTIENLGNIGMDVRNPYLCSALEILSESENRYSGIPIMREEMGKYSLYPPFFESRDGVFRVTFYNSIKREEEINDQDILSFCSLPRSRKELVSRFSFESLSYFMKKYVNPLLESGMLKMTIPSKPNSKNQKFVKV